MPSTNARRCKSRSFSCRTTWLRRTPLTNRGACGKAAQRQDQRSWLTWNPIFWKTPLWNPDAFLNSLYQCTGSLLNRWTAAIWGGLILLGCAHWYVHMDRFARDSVGRLGPQQWILWGLAWIALKLLHEIGHGLACKQFGLPVRECGVVWIFGAPVPYVDASAAYRLSNKWHRIFISLAGMYVELFCAALAMVAYGFAMSDLVRHLCAAVVFAASVHTMLFNLNPLMRFDGYYALADWWEIPNLSQLTQSYSQYVWRRVMMGEKARPPSVPPGLERPVLLYVLASTVWRVVLVSGILLACQRLFWGAGLLLAIPMAAVWLGAPWWHWARSVWNGKESYPPIRRLAVVVGACAITGWGVFEWIPWPGYRSAPGVVEGQREALLRAETEGFVREVLVSSGEWVEAGQELVRLENRELLREAEDLRLQIELARSRRKELLDQGNVAAAQGLERYRQALERQRDESIEQADELTVRAPWDGQVTVCDLDERVGVFLNAGEPLLRLTSRAKQVRCLVSQDAYDAFQSSVGRDVHVALIGDHACVGKLVKLVPHATVHTDAEPLVTSAGGPLLVRPSATASDAKGTFELLDPRFEAIVAIDTRTRFAGRRGAVAKVRLRRFTETAGNWLLRSGTQWLDRR